MKSLNGVGLGLSLVFGCLLLALVAEVYYLLWWKRRLVNRELQDGYGGSPARELMYMFCWKKPSSMSSTALNPQELCSSVNTHEPQAQLHRKDLFLKPFRDDDTDSDFMNLNGLWGPPRFLFSIKEETKEDLESEDGKSRRGERSRKCSRNRSLSDLLLTGETPFLTPLSSPLFFTPPMTPGDPSHNHHGFNPLFESSSDAEFNGMRSSPPPRFKFLQDAEEKLRRKVAKKEEEREDGASLTIVVSKNSEKETMDQYLTGSSQVLPLVSSPSTLKPPANFKPNSQ